MDGERDSLPAARERDGEIQDVVRHERESAELRWEWGMGSGEWGKDIILASQPHIPFFFSSNPISAAKTESGCEASFPNERIFQEWDRFAVVDRVQLVWRESDGFRFPSDCLERFAESECSPYDSLCHILLRYSPGLRNSLCGFGRSFRTTPLSESCGSGDSNPLLFPSPVSKCRGPDKIRSSYFSLD